MSGRSTVRLLGLIGIVLLPALVSQQLPSMSTERSAIPTLLLLAFGGAIGWVRPTRRAWLALAAGTVAAAVAILVSWTDLILDVGPFTGPVEEWRNDVFLAIVGSVVSTSAGFVAAMALRRLVTPSATRSSLRPAWATIVGLTAAVALIAAASALTAAAFSRTSIVVQDDHARLTITVTNDGISVSPFTIDPRTDYRLIYASEATANVWLTRIVPLGVADGVPQAMTTGEIQQWLAGDWEAMGPRFQNAVGWGPIRPGQRVDVGLFHAGPSSDPSGGVLWYTSAPDAMRDWPGNSFEGERPQAPWPVLDHLIVPVGP